MFPELHGSQQIHVCINQDILGVCPVLARFYPRYCAIAAVSMNYFLLELDYPDRPVINPFGRAFFLQYNPWPVVGIHSSLRQWVTPKNVTHSERER